MSTIIVDFSSRHSEHSVGGRPTPRLDYLLSKFEEAKKSATPDAPVDVRGILTPNEIKDVRRRFGIKPTDSRVIERDRSYDVTFSIAHDQRI